MITAEDLIDDYMNQAVKDAVTVRSVTDLIEPPEISGYPGAEDTKSKGTFDDEVFAKKQKKLAQDKIKDIIDFTHGAKSIGIIHKGL